MIVGRLAPEAAPVRGEAFAAGQRYFRGIQRAGGIPLMVPPIPELIERFPELLDRADGLLLHGGGDVDPRRYGQNPLADELYGIVPDHDDVELAIVTQAVAADIPVLAICRGIQVLNVALGGTLRQDIGTDDHWHGFREVRLDPSSQLAGALGTEQVRHCHCVHHQDLDEVAPTLRVVGRDVDDGLIHAVESTEASWVIGVQWHPEDTALDDAEQQRLFDALVATARTPART